MINFKGVLNIKGHGCYNTQNIVSWREHDYGSCQKHLDCFLANRKYLNLYNIT